MARKKRIFREWQHPRDSRGRFAEKGSSAWAARAASAYQAVNPSAFSMAQPGLAEGTPGGVRMLSVPKRKGEQTTGGGVIDTKALSAAARTAFPAKLPTKRSAAELANRNLDMPRAKTQTASMAPTTPAKRTAYDMLFDPDGPDNTTVKHRQTRQLLEQMEQHGWKLTEQNPQYQTTQWKAPDGRELGIQFITGDKPKVYGGRRDQSMTFKAAMERVVTPKLEPVSGPNVVEAMERAGLKPIPRAYEYNKPRDLMQKPLEDAQQAMGAKGMYGGQGKTAAEAAEMLRQSAARYREAAATADRLYGFGSVRDSKSEERERHAAEFERVADELLKMDAEHKAYEAEVKRRKALPLDIRESPRSAKPAKRVDTPRDNAQTGGMTTTPEMSRYDVLKQAERDEAARKRKANKPGRPKEGTLADAVKGLDQSSPLLRPGSTNLYNRFIRSEDTERAQKLQARVADLHWNGGKTPAASWKQALEEDEVGRLPDVRERSVQASEASPAEPATDGSRMTMSEVDAELRRRVNERKAAGGPSSLEVAQQGFAKALQRAMGEDPDDVGGGTPAPTGGVDLTKPSTLPPAPKPGAAGYSTLGRPALLAMARMAEVDNPGRKSNTELAEALAAKDEQKRAGLNPSGVGTPEARRAAVREQGGRFSGNPLMILPKYESLTDDDWSSLTDDERDSARLVMAKLAKRDDVGDRAKALQRRFGTWDPSGVGQAAEVPTPAPKRTAAERKIDSARKRVETLQGRVDAAAERRRNKGARIQSSTETKARADLADARRELEALEAQQKLATDRASGKLVGADILEVDEAIRVTPGNRRDGEKAWKAGIRERLNLPTWGDEPLTNKAAMRVPRDQIKVGDIINEDGGGFSFQVAGIRRRDDGSVWMFGPGITGRASRVFKADETGDVKVWRPGQNQDTTPLRADEDDLNLMTRRMLQGFDDERARWEAAERVRASKGLPSRPFRRAAPKA